MGLRARRERPTSLCPSVHLGLDTHVHAHVCGGGGSPEVLPTGRHVVSLCGALPGLPGEPPLRAPQGL